MDATAPQRRIASRPPREVPCRRSSTSERLHPSFFSLSLSTRFLERRQKEKKELASYQGSASGLSSAGSAPDQDANTSDAGDFTFSSSPAPLRPASSSSSVYIPLPQLGSDTAASLDTIPFLRPSLEIYGSAAPPTAPTKRSSLPDATNTSSFPSLLPPVPFPTASFAKQQPAASLHARAQAQNMAFVHRPSGHSIIAAKKHVKKRPLGSHAPLARTPALPHAFEFPASPPKGAVVARPSLKRKGSSGSVASTTSNSSRTAPTLFMNEGGRARVWVDALSTGELAASPDAIDHVREPASRRASLETRDEVWQRMQSDLPSPSNSPAPLTRKMMRALAAEASGLDALALAGGQADTTRALSPPPFVIPARSNSGARGSASGGKPTLTRKLSLARGAEGSRAGGEETCAFSAFERKRARMTETGSSSTTTSTSARRPAPSRSRSTPALHAPTLISRTSSGYVLSANATAATLASAAAALTASRPCAARRFSSATTAKPAAPTSDSLSDGDAPFEDDDEGDSSMGELSFGSASTDTTTSSSSSYRVAPAVSAIAKPAAAVGAGKTAVDEERECAELLLGLGGFF
mgnify:CR=1 FL=1